MGGGRLIGGAKYLYTLFVLKRMRIDSMGSMQDQSGRIIIGRDTNEHGGMLPNHFYRKTVGRLKDIRNALFLAQSRFVGELVGRNQEIRHPEEIEAWDSRKFRARKSSYK